MNAGSRITGNTTTAQGGGVMVWGTFIMHGGEISGNTSNQGGGVQISAGIFTMHGGYISGNTSRGSGGGVMNFGIFDMRNGTIAGNTAINNGGGIMNWGTFRISDGIIHGSNATVELRNTAGGNNAALFSQGTSQRGKFSNGGFLSPVTLPTTNNTFQVRNGDLVCPGCNGTLPCTACARTREESVQRVVFTADTATVTFPNLSGNNIYLFRANTSENIVNTANIGSVLNASPSSTRTTAQPLGSRSLMPGVELPPFIIGCPQAREFNANPPPFDREGSALPAPLTTFVPPVVGDTRPFWVQIPHGSGNWEQVTAVLLATGTHGNIWVVGNEIS